MGQIAASVNGLKVQKVLSQKNDSGAATIASKVDDSRRRRTSRERRRSSSAPPAASCRTSCRRARADAADHRAGDQPGARERASSSPARENAQRARFSCLTSTTRRLGSPSRFRWTYGFVGAGVFVVRPTAVSRVLRPDDRRTPDRSRRSLALAAAAVFLPRLLRGELGALARADRSDLLERATPKSSCDCRGWRRP